MCSVLLGIIASEEINWRERGRGGDQNKILKINKVCVCTAVTLKSDSFHLAIVFYFTLYFFFFFPPAHFEIQTIWRDPQRPRWCCCVMQNGASFKLQLSLNTDILLNLICFCVVLFLIF